jgi:hypothetical protein
MGGTCHGGNSALNSPDHDNVRRADGLLQRPLVDCADNADASTVPMRDPALRNPLSNPVRYELSVDGGYRGC